MDKLAAALTLALCGLTAVASADAIQKWRTPSGSFYFGDHPPQGSALVQTYPDTGASAVTVVPSDAAFSQAAADGREIMRQREAERAESRRADTEREARQAEIDARASYDSDYPFWFLTSTVSPCRCGDDCSHQGHHPHHGDDRPRRIGEVRIGGGQRFLTPLAPPQRIGMQGSTSRGQFLR